jgi:hypothetical protein
MVDSNTAISQNTFDLVKVEPNLDNDTYLTPYRCGNEFVNMKVGEVMDVEMEDPLTLKLPEVKSEREVGTCIQYWALLLLTYKPFVFSISVCLSVHMK